MFDTSTVTCDSTVLPALHALAPDAAGPSSVPELEALLRHLPLQRRHVERRQTLFHAGQTCHSLYLIHAGFFKTCVVGENGHERITGFHMRGQLLGIDSFGAPTHACDAIALESGEVWEVPVALIRERVPEFLPQVTSMLASEIRRDWRWMLATGSLNAEQRVVSFLLDLGTRLEALGFSSRHLMLRMTRAELGNFLALQLETVTRALSRLAASGLITVSGREIRLNNPTALRKMLAG